MTVFITRFWIKIRHWEYWPFGIIQAPLFIYWLWLSVKARSLFYFSASNPSILTGGMIGESKFDVLNLIPEEFKPKTILIRRPADVEQIRREMENAGISFPCVFKPDIGQRGWKVQIIHHSEEASDYLSDISTDFLIQEFVAAAHEYGVFYVRKPDEPAGRVVSVTGKKMLAVTGDGKTTLHRLIRNNSRAFLQQERLEKIFSSRWNEIIPAGEEIVLNKIGNHCLGTCFLDHGHLISDELNQSFEIISKQINGFYFGRFDLRCHSPEDLIVGKIKILELNGCGAEPAHIYEPGYNLIKAMRVLLRHMYDMYEVSVQNKKRGIPYLSFREGVQIYRYASSIMGK
jgi:hypothetical protein